MDSVHALMNGEQMPTEAAYCYNNVQHALEQNAFQDILIGVNCNCSLKDVARTYGYTTMLVVLPLLVYTMFEKKWAWR
jgi:hypothetical protein